MITKVYPSVADYDNLSRLKTEMSPHANAFDYSNVVVNKPWGYEYLWRQNAQTAIWMLNLNYEGATSLHCHVVKRTSLIVLSGQVVCSTLDNRFYLPSLHAVVLEAGVFHSTRAISKEGAQVMEIETPPLKGDLARLRDSFGREKRGYETTAEYSTELGEYNFTPCVEGFGKVQRCGQTRLLVSGLENQSGTLLESPLLMAPLSEPLDDPQRVEIGEILEVKSAQQVLPRGKEVLWFLPCS